MREEKNIIIIVRCARPSEKINFTCHSTILTEVDYCLSLRGVGTVFEIISRNEIRGRNRIAKLVETGTNENGLMRRKVAHSTNIVRLQRPQSSSRTVQVSDSAKQKLCYVCVQNSLFGAQFAPNRRWVTRMK